MHLHIKFKTNKEHTFAFWVKVDTTTDDGNAIIWSR